MDHEKMEDTEMNLASMAMMVVDGLILNLKPSETNWDKLIIPMKCFLFITLFKKAANRFMGLTRHASMNLKCLPLFLLILFHVCFMIRSTDNSETILSYGILLVLIVVFRFNYLQARLMCSVLLLLFICLVWPAFEIALNFTLVLTCFLKVMTLIALFASSNFRCTKHFEELILALSLSFFLNILFVKMYILVDYYFCFSVVYYIQESLKNFSFRRCFSKVYNFFNDVLLNSMYF